jgi:hypothetical protein
MAYESSPRRIERARKALARDKGVDPDDLKYIGDQEGAHAGQLGTHLFNIMDPSHPNYKSTVGWPMDRTIETTQGEIMSIWTEVKARGIPYDNYESDLYIPVTDETTALLRKLGIKFSTFRNRVEGGLWYDIPFAYEPWWEKRQAKSNPWKARVRDTYSTLEELEAYDETYGIVKRLGYRSARRLWDANPMIGGSVYPEDLRVIRRGERLSRTGTHLPPARRNPKREFEECGCCGEYHPSDFHGDCRDDKNRFNYEQIPGGSIVWEQDERGRWVWSKKEKFEEYVERKMRSNPDPTEFSRETWDRAWLDVVGETEENYEERHGGGPRGFILDQIRERAYLIEGGGELPETGYQRQERERFDRDDGVGTIYCPACRKDVKADETNETSMADHGRCFDCQKKWTVGELEGEEIRPNPMKLMTKEIERKARAQYAKGSELEGQMIVAKFFDPQGSWTWYLMNQDPNEPDYLWGIVSGFEVEMGSFSLSELQSVRGRFGLGIERDLYFHPIPAKEAWDRLLAGEHI